MFPRERIGRVQVESANSASASDRVTGGRVARKRAERRRDLERTAAEVFAERGYEGANFDEIGARLNLRGASLYHYYASKEDLFLRAVENAHAEVLARLRPIVDTDQPVEERLRRLFAEQALIEFRDYPAFAPLFLMSVPVPAIARRLTELRREHGDIFRTLAREVAERHGVPRRQASIAVLLALGSLAYVHSWYNPGGELNIEQMTDEIADQLLQPFLGTDGRIGPQD